jgi:hypothetical protein
MKPYHLVSGIIFGVVALVHLLRLINQWPLILGPWSAPMSISWVAFIIAGYLSVWSFRLIRSAR